jgi:hypothetical protein
MLCWIVVIKPEARRSQWPRGLRRRSAAARLLRLWVRISPESWIFVCCKCCVFSGSCLCDGLITRPEKCYRLWCVVVCDLETSWMRRPWSTGGCCAKLMNCQQLDWLYELSHTHHTHTHTRHTHTHQTTHTHHIHTPLSRTPLDEWSARRRDLCPTPHNVHKRRSCFRWDYNPQTHALGRTATRIGFIIRCEAIKSNPVKTTPVYVTPRL